jgi:hypothetical protein
MNGRPILNWLEVQRYIQTKVATVAGQAPQHENCGLYKSANRATSSPECAKAVALLDGVRGLFSFATICSFGAIANVGIAALLFNQQHSFWLVACIAGAAMSAV